MPDERVVPDLLHRARSCGLALAAAFALAACGGGGSNAEQGPSESAAACELPAQKTWLKSYMDDWYFWFALEPQPPAEPFGSIAAYFDALLYAGADAGFPADRWSYTQPSTTFDQFYGAGQALGWGVFVAGLEVAGQPAQPLRVRYVEPASPAAGQVQRGDTVVSVNGRAASELVAVNDFSALVPSAQGDQLALRLRDLAGGEREVTLTAAVHTLTPLSRAATLSTPAGTPVGYVMLKDFIAQSLSPLDAAFAQFKAAGVRELVLDLRYNGGGLVSVANELASLAVGASVVGQPFATLAYSDRKSASDSTYRFAARAAALGVVRVYVLSGARTCSASELVINGLKPFVNVVQIGDTTCGKPVGFVPQSRCGTTYSAVNFESKNADGEGRYWNGLTPACPLADDLDHPLGDPAERLAAAALTHIDSGSCPVAAERERPQALRAGIRRMPEAGEARGMIGR